MKRLTVILATLALMPMLSGCAAPVVAGLTISHLSYITSLVLVGSTGKDLGDHALSAITSKNCNLTEGLLRSDRDICEPENSLATAEDFHGVFAFFGGDRTDPLTRFARARQQEMLAQSDDTNYAMARNEIVPKEAPIGFPARGGNPGYVQVNGKLVYAMAPVYSAGDEGRTSGAIIVRQGETVTPRPKPKYKGPEIYPSLRTAELSRSR